MAFTTRTTPISTPAAATTPAAAAPGRRLVWAAAALPAANVIHALAPAPHHQHEAIAGPIMGTIVTVGAIVALAGLLRRREWAARLALIVAGATAAGFVLFHALPVRTSVTEPYWGDDGSASTAQALTLVLIAAAVVWVVVEASAYLRLRSRQSSS
jgi:hypothetical protein